jgi:hypothetical protein
MAEKLPTAMSAARTKAADKIKPKDEDAETHEEATDAEDETPELTDEERKANREAHLRMWPLEEADEKR